MARIVLVLFLASIHYGSEAKSVGYPSSVVEDGRPILRLRDDDETESGDDKDQPLSPGTHEENVDDDGYRTVYWEPDNDSQKGDTDINASGADYTDVPESWKIQVQRAIERVRLYLGDEESRPFVQKLIDATDGRVSLYFERDGNESSLFTRKKEKSEERFQPKEVKNGGKSIFGRHDKIEKAEKTEEHVISKKETKNNRAFRATNNENIDVALLKSDPEWVEDMRTFVKHLIARYGKGKHLDLRLKPVVKAVERANNVRIEDIDVDHFGDIQIEYTKKKKSRNAT